mgnify:CR=1 FL=1
MTDFIIMREQLEYHVRTFCADYLNFRRRKYDGSDEWIKRRLLGYAQICRDLSSKTGLRENAKHAYNFIHALVDEDRERIRYLYRFYQIAVKLSRKEFFKI